MKHHLFKFLSILFLAIQACTNRGGNSNVPPQTTPPTSTTSTPTSTTPITTTNTSTTKVIYTANDSLRWALTYAYGVDSADYNPVPIIANAQTVGVYPGEGTFNSADIAFIYKEVLAGNYPKPAGTNARFFNKNQAAKPRPMGYRMRKGTGTSIYVDKEPETDLIVATLFIYHK